jgi:hypothetical protein
MDLLIISLALMKTDELGMVTVKVSLPSWESYVNESLCTLSGGQVLILILMYQ